MRLIKPSSLSAATALALALLIQGCASSSSDPREPKMAAPACGTGEMLICESRSSSRISDGRYGRGNNGRRKVCGCVPEREMERLEGATLPADTH
jgi:hypothetical protein